MDARRRKMLAFVKSDSQYIAAGTIVRIDGFVGMITEARVDVRSGIAGWPTYVLFSPATGESLTLTVNGATVIEIPAQ